MPNTDKALQMRASFYKAYAQRLSTWGFAVLQYNTPLLRVVEDVKELECLICVLDWLAAEVVRPGSRVHGKVNLASVGIAGHSRGGKLAALHFAGALCFARVAVDSSYGASWNFWAGLAGSDRFKAAFLIDPVDNTKDAPESPVCPNASKALRASGKRVGMVGAGVIGSCNPEGSNYKVLMKLQV